MRLAVVNNSFLLLFLCAAQACWGTDYLYTPQPVTGESHEGVLVREIVIKKGDTLSRLSKQLSGHGYYYPQILLFNEIKNPHWIYPGQVIRVPLSHKAAGQHPHEKPASKKQHHQNKTTVTPVASKAVSEPALPTLSEDEKKSYERAMSSFKKGDCTAAIKLIDEFIVRYPGSSLLPEATLNRAECYLRLSAK